MSRPSHRRRLPAVRLVLGLILGAAALPALGKPAAPERPTLAANRRLPAAALKERFSPAQWEKMRHLEYDAYALLDGQIAADGSVQIRKIRELVPDATWEPLVRALAGRIVLQASSTGSSIRPRAQICVIFFKPQLDGKLALIFAQQAGDLGPGVTQRPVFFTTERY